jgi:hypothetical protein
LEDGGLVRSLSWPMQVTCLLTLRPCSCNYRSVIRLATGNIKEDFWYYRLEIIASLVNGVALV